MNVILRQDKLQLKEVYAELKEQLNKNNNNKKS